MPGICLYKSQEPSSRGRDKYIKNMVDSYVCHIPMLFYTSTKYQVFISKLFFQQYVKGVGAQDRRTTATQLVALASNGAGDFAQALYNGEGEEDERE